jgi:hypothetical protein
MRARIAQPWLRWVAVGVVVAAGSAVLIVSFWLGGLTGLGTAAAVLVLAPLAVALVAWARKSHTGTAAASGDQIEQARRELAAKVREQWLAECGARRLYDPNPVVVKWRLTKGTVGTNGTAGETLSRTVAGTRGLVGRADQVDELARWFRDLDRHRVVIIGKPGMGKTTLAVQLLLELLKEGPGADRLPTPVMFSLASFEPGRTDIDTWLARRLEQEHPWLRAAYGAGLAASLVRQRRILPVLDGLDEIPENVRPAVIAALNRAMADGELGLVLTCRTAEYAAAVQAGDVLRAAAVIQSDPLRPGQVADYLKSCVPPSQADAWRPVLAKMRRRPAPPLTKALATPLMLWLVRHVYFDRGLDPAVLADEQAFPTAEAIQQHLAEDLIPALIEANPPDAAQPGRPRRRWDPDKAQLWLRNLARHLSQLGTADLAWWQLWQAVPTASFGLSAGFAVAVGAGLAVAIPGPTAGPVLAGIVVGLAAGITGGLGVILVLARWRSPVSAASVPGRSAAARVTSFFLSAAGAILVAAIGSGLTVGLAFGLSSWISSGPAAGIRAGLAPALAGAAAGGLGIGFAAVRRAMPQPARGLRPRVSISGLAAGLVAALGVGLAVGLPYGLGDGVYTGLAGGLSIALSVMLEGAPGDAEAVSPRVVLRHDRASAMVVALAAGLGIGFVFGLGFPAGTAIGIGSFAGLGFAVVVTLLRAPWLSYTLARSWLALTGQLPWRLMGFLEDAHQLGVLRQVGTVYQFRHIDLQRHLSHSDNTAGRRPARPTGRIRRN